MEPTTSSPPQTALVTGANRGIGQAIANQLTLRGIHVLHGYRDLTTLSEKPSPNHIQIDLSAPDSIQSCVNKIQDQFGKLDILINNAATLLDRELPLEDLTPETFQETLHINTVAQFSITQSLLPLLKAAHKARVINISSGAGQLENMMQWSPAYGISKAALNALTIQQALAYKKFGISVNGVRPGWVRTRMGGDQAPLSPDEGADTAVWLATETPHEQTGLLWFQRNPTHW